MENSGFKSKLVTLIIMCLLAGRVFSNSQVIKDIVSKNWDSYSIETVKLLYLDAEVDYYHLGLVFLAHDDYNYADSFFIKSNHLHANYYLALSAYKQNKLDLAQNYIQKYFVQNKSNSAYSLYIDILTDLGDIKNIEMLFKKLDSNKEALTAELMYKQGKFYLSSGSCEKAIAKFKQVLKNHPGFTKLNKMLSKAYQQCNQPILAHEYMSKEAGGTIVSHDALLINLYEYGNPAYLLKPKMLALINNNNYSKALEIAKKLVVIQPKDETSWINYGSLLKKSNQMDQAIIAYEQAYKLNPRNVLTIENIVKTFWKHDRDKAIIWIDRLLAINPKHIIGLRVKGDFLNSKGDTEAAIKYYKLSLQQSPEDTYLLKQLTLIYLNKSKGDIAIKMLDDAFRVSNKNITIANYLARTLMISQYNNEDSRQRALRISRTIYQLKGNYINKFTLLMALRLNKLDKEADKLLLELKQIPLKPSQKKYKEALEVLEEHDKFINNLNPDWMW